MIEINSYGEAEFTYKKVRRDKSTFKGYFKGRGTIIDIDVKTVLFEDNDNFQYIVDRTKFKFKKI